MTRTRDVSVAAGAILHGPVDVGITLAHWHLEANPIVLTMGQTRWIALKALVISFLCVWYWAVLRSKKHYAVELVHAFALTGAVIVGWNLGVLYL